MDRPEHRIFPFITIPCNICVACGNELVVVETEYSIQDINENGFSTNVLASKYDTYLKCSACGKKYKILENWDGSISPNLDDAQEDVRKYLIKNDFVQYARKENVS